MIRNTSPDRGQWRRYKDVLGSECPKSLAEFQRVKYTDGERWARTKWDYRFENQYRAKDETELLPGFEEAYGIKEKLTSYTLNPAHVTGKHKAKVFKAALGYDLSNAADLENEIRNGLKKYRAVSMGDKGFGSQYRVKMLVSGPHGKQPVDVGWIIDNGETGQRMVNAIVDDANKRP